VTGFFQKILGKEKRHKQPAEPSHGPDTIPLPPAHVTEVHSSETSAEGQNLEMPQIVAGCAQSVGRQRDHNEDALFMLTSQLASDTRQIPFGLYIVADGMGGHQHGELASASAIRAMAGYIIRKLYLPLFNQTSSPPSESLQEIVQEGVAEAHQAIVKQALGGGTTLTSVLVLGDQMTVAHVGDSRAYLFNAEGEIEILTRDHSLVRRLVELGQITDEEAATHPQRNVLYRALGQGEPFEPDIITIPLPRLATILLCSDGLWGVVDQEEILSIIKTIPAPQEACQKLIEAANTGGGPDNISAVLVHIQS